MALIIGTPGNDFRNGTNQPDTILGLGGNDVINGNNGDDVILGGTGNDVVSGGNGDDVISGEEGDDTINGNNGDDVLVGNEGADILTGGNGVDVFSGGAGGDVLALDRDDRFAEGGVGLDTAVLTGSGAFDLRGELAGIETLTQGAGNATVTLSDLLFTTLEGNKLNIDLGAGNDTVTIQYRGSLLDFDRGSGEASEVIFGPTGGALNNSIDFDNVEHLNFFNTDTGQFGNFDFWLT